MKARVIVETNDHRDVIFVATNVETSQTNEIEDFAIGEHVEHRLTGRRFLTIHAEFDPAQVEPPKDPEPDTARVDVRTGEMTWTKEDVERLQERVRRMHR